MLCCLTPSITAKGKKREWRGWGVGVGVCGGVGGVGVGVCGGGGTIKRIEIRYGWEKMSRMKTHIGCIDIENLEGRRRSRRRRRRRRTPLTFNDPLCSMAVPNNSLEYCVNIWMQSSYDYGSGYDCKMCWSARER